ncbi:MAG: EAL domain-containing response regulator [Woeseiaceae bacterium]|nr:EAL domain-containing response regulator [Woeseiaceae bacterium]
MARVCRDSGFEAIERTDCADIETVLQSSRLKLIVTDLQMPDCDGIELMRLLAGVRTDVPVAIFSGFDPRAPNTAEAFGRSIGLQIVETLQKPLSVAALKRLFRGAGDQVVLAPEEELQRAIRNHEVRLHFQPKVSFRAEDFGRVVGFEGLARWHHPVQGVISPDRFIPLAESSGLIGELTDDLIQYGLEQVAEWQRNGETWSLAINISPHILEDRGLADRIAQLAARAGVEPSRITLEITESGAMADPTRTMEILTRLRLKGFKLSIDDFGTGFSSLVQLYNLPFSELKIDKSFVMDIDDREEAQVIVRTLIDLAHNLSLQACAEGVETMAEWSQLLDYGCDRIQGYFAGRPMPAEDIPAWAEEWETRSKSITDMDRQRAAADG